MLLFRNLVGSISMAIINHDHHCKDRSILITGATGFVGRNVVTELLKDNYNVSAIVRRQDEDLEKAVSQKVVGDFIDCTDWDSIVSGEKNIIHLAACTNTPHNLSKLDHARLFKLNVKCSLDLAQAAINAGVKRFIFLSSIKVNGETSDQPLNELDKPNPKDEYAQSKFEAELQLKKLIIGSPMELVIIRTPIIYGNGVTGNFLKLSKLVKNRIPLPLGSVQNKRSLCSISNLIDFIKLSIHHPDAKNELFFVADSKSLSTPELISLMGKCFGKSVILLPVPLFLLKFTSAIFRKKELTFRLINNLEVDIKKANDVLNWSPTDSVDAGIKRTINYYNPRQHRQSKYHNKSNLTTVQN